MRFWVENCRHCGQRKKIVPFAMYKRSIGHRIHLNSGCWWWFYVELVVGCPPGIMNVILAAEHSPCDEFDDYGDHLDWRFCAFRALDNGCILVVTQSKWRWVTKMVDSNEVHKWRWIIWGVCVHLCILVYIVYTINHSGRSCWASDSSRWIVVNPGQAKPSSSKAMLQPIPFLQVRNTHLPKKPTRSTQHRQEEKTTACLIQASGIPSIFTLVATLIAASVSVCPVKSNAAASCAKAWRAWRGPQTWHQVTKPPLRWRFEITSFLSLSGGGGRQNCQNALKTGGFWWFPPDAIERICSTMMIETLSLLYSSVWCIAINDIHYLKGSRIVQLFNWFPSKGNLDNVFQFETTWGLEIWWAATNVDWASAESLET